MLRAALALALFGLTGCTPDVETESHEPHVVGRWLVLEWIDDRAQGARGERVCSVVSSRGDFYAACPAPEALACVADVSLAQPRYSLPADCVPTMFTGQSPAETERHDVDLAGQFMELAAALERAPCEEWGDWERSNRWLAEGPTGTFVGVRTYVSFEGRQEWEVRRLFYHVPRLNMRATIRCGDALALVRLMYFGTTDPRR
jgi:hypothetical protein